MHSRTRDSGLAESASDPPPAERRAAREGLRESEAQLGLALAAGRMGTWEWDVASDVVRWSSGLEAIHGLAPGTFEGTFAAFQKDVHPDDRARVVEAIRRTIERGEDHRIEYRIVWPDGSLHWLEGRGRLFRDESGVATRMIGVCMDVTERQLAEETLRRSELELADFFESAAVALHWVGPDGTILRVNQAELDLLGYRRDEYVGRNITDFHVDRPVIDDILARLTHGETLHEYPARLRCKDGTIREVLISSSGLIENGRFVHTRCFTRDVTEKKRTEQALRESEERFRTLADSSPVLIWVNGLEGCEFVNRTYREFLGVGDADVRGYDWARFVHPDDREAYVDAYRRATSRSDAFHAEFRFRRHDGAYRWMRSVGHPRYGSGGELLGYVGSTFDITEAKKTEEALREREERYDLVLTGAEAAIWDWDVPRKRVVFSSRWKRLRGLSDDEVSDREEEWSGGIHPDDVERVMGAVRAHFEGRTPFFSEEYRVLHKDGRWLWVLDRGIARRDATGRVVRMAGSETDITERKRVEEALREADRRKDEFLATLAHELRNPLAPLRNGLELMKRARGDDSSLDQARSMMERQLSHMVRLIDDLLDVSRISRGRIALRTERVELAPIVEDAVAAVRPMCEGRSQELTVVLPAEPTLLDADPTRLGQVLGNLLHNASKFSPRGGRIRLAAERDADQVVLRVSDTGIGIAADHLPHIFEMFSQVEPSPELSQPGLGIGLSLVRRLVELHGGTVAAQSGGVGRGSEFVVRLPLVDPGRASPRPAVELPHVAQPRRCVLVVDDNHDSAESLALLLEQSGHEVGTAFDGPEALEASAKLQPDVILLDIGLPGLDGYEVARRIRARRDPKAPLLVALTGWGQDADRRRSAEAGFDEHLVKPVDPGVIAKILARSTPREG